MLNHNHSHHKTAKIGASLSVIALSISALLLLSCTNNNEIREGQTNVTREDVAQVSANDKLIGQTVTIRSQVEQNIDKNGFVLQSSQGQPILVLNTTKVPFTVPNQEIPVQATGQVQAFSIADINQQYGLTLDPNLYREYDRQPVILAQSVALAPTPEDLAKAPTGYFDKTIAVKGEVRKLDSNRSFALFEQGWVDDIGVLVVGVDGDLKGGSIQEGELVVVTGEARQANAQLLQSNLGWDTDKANEFLSRYTNRPIIVAKEVYPSAVKVKSVQ